MRRRTFVLGMGAATAGGSALLGAGAYTRTESGRGVTIETVGDDDAYLRLEYNDGIEFACETEATLLRVTNQLASPISEVNFDVVGNTDGIGVEVVDVPTALGIGEEGAIVANLTHEGADGERTVNFDVEAVGDDLEVTAHRTDEIAIASGCRERTAWALRVEADGTTDPTSHRLEEIPDIRTDGWGWYVPYAVGSGTVRAELWAGAEGNDLDSGTLVGEVEIDDDGSVVTIEPTTVADAALSESYLSVGTTTDRLRETGADPDRFEYASSGEAPDGGTGAYEIPLSDVADEPTAGDELVVAFHGVLSG